MLSIDAAIIKAEKRSAERTHRKRNIAKSKPVNIEEEGLRLFELLYKNGVRFILVGGLAVNYHGFSRSTGDVDIWVEDSRANREKLVSALKEFGVNGAEAFLTYPLKAGIAEILISDGFYVDLMDGLQSFTPETFDECYETADTVLVNNTPVKVLHINRLIEEKKKSPRLKDQLDAEQLEKIIRSGKK